MQIENKKEEVPFAHYVQRFRALNPPEAASWAKDVQWNGKEFGLRLLSRGYAVSHPEYAIRALDGKDVPPLPQQIFLLRYLLETPVTAPTGAWKTFRELPWGELYHIPYTGRILKRAAFAFGPRLSDFRTACEKTGGIPVEQGDAGFEFAFIGNFRMRIYVWEGDEEFPPGAQILYSDNFGAGFTAEDRVVAAEILISAIRKNMPA